MAPAHCVFALSWPGGILIWEQGRPCLRKEGWLSQATSLYLPCFVLARPHSHPYPHSQWGWYLSENLAVNKVHSRGESRANRLSKQNTAKTPSPLSTVTSAGFPSGGTRCSLYSLFKSYLTPLSPSSCLFSAPIVGSDSAAV